MKTLLCQLLSQIDPEKYPEQKVSKMVGRAETLTTTAEYFSDFLLDFPFQYSVSWFGHSKHSIGYSKVLMSNKISAIKFSEYINAMIRDEAWLSMDVKEILNFLYLEFIQNFYFLSTQATSFSI